MKVMIYILIVMQSILSANADTQCVMYVGKCEKHELVKTVDWREWLLPPNSSYYSYSFSFIYLDDSGSGVKKRKGINIFNLGVFEDNDRNEQVIMDGKYENVITSILKTRCESEREIYLELMEMSKNSESCI
jgi:hypothetical protein